MHRTSPLALLLLVLPPACFSPNQTGDAPGTGTGTVETETAETEAGPPGTATDPPSTSEGDTTSEATTKGADSESGITDQEGPSIIEATPADGSTGVAADENIVITFSEPMDHPSTESAFSSDTIGSWSFSWSPDSSVLTVQPEQALPYGEGSDPILTPAIEYEFSLGTNATDEAGNPLALGISSSFTTLRRITNSLSFAPPLSGVLRSGVPINGGTVTAGDNDDNDQLVSVLSFELPAGDLRGAFLETSTFAASQSKPSGLPYSLGNLELEVISFATLAEASVAPAALEFGAVSTDSTEDISAALDEVTRAALESNADYLQMRFRFPTSTNEDSTSDIARFSTPSITLDLAFLLD